MKKLLTLLFLFPFVALANDAKSINALSWSLLYGRSQLNDGHKKVDDIAPTGGSYKFIVGNRSKMFEWGLAMGYQDLSDEFTFSGTDGELKHKRLTFGIQGGLWIFKFLQARGGYAKHYISEDISGEFTTAQKTTLKTDYGLRNESTDGIYFGGDLVLLQSKMIQLFVSYDNYHLNRLKGNSWEAMAGLRLYTDSPKGIGKGNFFAKMFKGIFGVKE